MNSTMRGLDASMARAMAREQSNINTFAARVEIQKAAILAMNQGYSDRMQGLPMPEVFCGDLFLEGAWKYGTGMAEQTILELQANRRKRGRGFTCCEG